MHLVNAKWEFQDSNWFPDFAASAQKMEWFYQKGRGATVDGVIAINASMLERFLRVVGPIESDEYGLLLSADTALQDLQVEVEVDYDKEENKPKAVIADVLEQLLTGLKEIDATSAVQLLAELHDAAQQREVQVFTHDNSVQKKIQSFGWTGEIVQTAPTQDYLMVVNTNLQGQKSDAKIEQEVFHQAVVQEDGSIIDTVRIKRTHNGRPGEQFYGGANINYMRLYVPDGAELLSAGGFSYPPEEAFDVPESWYSKDTHLAMYEQEKGFHAESGTRVTQEFGKTAFGNWMIVEPGKSSEVYFSYKLPMRVRMDADEGEATVSKWKDLFLSGLQRHGSRYSLFIQKQSGVEGHFRSEIIYPNNWTPVWRSRDDVDLALNGAIFDTDLKYDEIVGLVMEKK
jgi:hypothetical protein